MNMTKRRHSVLCKRHKQKSHMNIFVKENKSVAEKQRSENYEAPLDKWRRIAKRFARQSFVIKAHHVVKNLATEETVQPTNNRIPFNPNHYKAQISFATLSASNKLLLCKVPEARTENDMITIFQVVDKMKCFSKYSPDVRKGLAKFIYYNKFESGRVIVQQGRPALSYYIILSGAVHVVVNDNDTSGKIGRKNYAGEMAAGDSFGEYALLQGSNRRATIICKEVTEFLRLDKVDFDQVLRETYTNQWNEKMDHFTSMPVFQNWSPKDLQAAITLVKLRKYTENTVIFKGQPDPESVFLVKSGTCVMVKEMKLIKRSISFGREKLILPPERKNGENERRLLRLKKNESWSKYFLVVRILKKGDYFGVGENFENALILSKGKLTELLVLPKSALSSHNRGKTLETMKNDLLDFELSREEIFQNFVQVCKWQRYKKELVDNVFEGKPSKGHARYQDVPLCIRVANTN